MAAALAEEYEVDFATLAAGYSRNTGRFAAPQTSCALMNVPRPYALLAEISYRCPLHCPYCSNPTRARKIGELTTAEWIRVIREAAGLGVFQVGFSGGEPLVRRDLAELVRARARLDFTQISSRAASDWTKRALELREAGLDSVQLVFRRTMSILPTKSRAPARINASWRGPAHSRSGNSTQPQFCHSPAQHRSLAGDDSAGGRSWMRTGSNWRICSFTAGHF